VFKLKKKKQKKRSKNADVELKKKLSLKKLELCIDIIDHRLLSQTFFKKISFAAQT